MSQKVQPPKKPVNGYFRFQEEKMEAVKKANPDKPHKDLISIIGEMYSKLDVKKKQVYTDAYEKEKQVYLKKMAEYVAKYGDVPKKERKTKGPKESKEEKEIKKQIQDLGLPEKPKKNLTAFFCFKQEQVEKLKQQHPDKTYIQLSTILGEKWNSLSENDKKKYEEMSKKLGEKYEKELKTYNDKNKDKLEKVRELEKRLKKIRKAGQKESENQGVDKKAVKKSVEKAAPAEKSKSKAAPVEKDKNKPQSKKGNKRSQ